MGEIFFERPEMHNRKKIMIWSGSFYKPKHYETIITVKNTIKNITKSKHSSNKSYIATYSILQEMFTESI